MNNTNMPIEQLRALTDGVPYLFSNLSNISALLYDALPDVNWVGFYLIKDGELRLAPFQGKPACVKIPFGRGVCGSAVQADEVLIVNNVHEFPGHIACDSASNSEIVLPLHRKGRVIGVLDIDSPEIGRFNDGDKAFLEKFTEEIERLLSDQFDQF